MSVYQHCCHGGWKGLINEVNFYLISSTPDQSHRLPTTKEEDTVNSDDSDIEPLNQDLIMESRSKRNFFSKVALKLGLKRSEPTREEVFESMDISSLKIKEEVLSKYELERTPMPLLKNFIIQNIDASFINSSQRIDTKAK